MCTAKQAPRHGRRRSQGEVDARRLARSQSRGLSEIQTLLNVLGLSVLAFTGIIVLALFFA